MNYSEKELETVLRAAPQPAAPGALKQTLLAQVATKRFRPASLHGGSWLRRWWPALAPATVSLACAVVITAQQFQIHDLKQSLRTLRPVTVSTNIADDPALRLANNASTADASAAEQAEIQRLRQQAVKLSAEVTRLQGLRSENEKLRIQLATPRLADLTPEEKEAMEQAKDRAMSVACVNNLKQIGLAMRVWALDHEEAYPPNFLVISNELSTPKILVCPKDSARQAAANFSTFSNGNVSYEYLVPAEGDKPEREPERIMVRCPIHGNLGLADGSVQMGVGKNHPERIVERDGKLYLEDAPRKPATQPPTPGQQNK